MRRGEVGAFAAGFLVAALIGAVIVTCSAWLNGQQWFGGGANVIQWCSGPALVAAIGMAGWQRWNGRCGVAGCVRRGDHPVAGTTRKVCSHHHRLEHHEAVHALHRVEGLLGWGDSHTRGEPDG